MRTTNTPITNIFVLDTIMKELREKGFITWDESKNEQIQVQGYTMI